jgi:hypothetical protein
VTCRLLLAQSNAAADLDRGNFSLPDAYVVMGYSGKIPEVLYKIVHVNVDILNILGFMKC